MASAREKVLGKPSELIQRHNGLSPKRSGRDGQERNGGRGGTLSGGKSLLRAKNLDFCFPSETPSEGGGRKHSRENRNFEIGLMKRRRSRTGKNSSLAGRQRSSSNGHLARICTRDGQRAHLGANNGVYLRKQG